MTGRTFRIIVPRQQDETDGRSVRERSDPSGLGRHIGAGKAGARHRGPDRGVKALPFGEEGGKVVTLRPHARPPTESIRLVSDLKGEKLRANGARHISRLSSHVLRRAGREIEPVDEPPAQRTQEAGEAVNRGWRDDEVFALYQGVLRTP